MKMAIYRTVSMSFWTDNKVADDFTPEDRYFYLYLFTNPHTNLCGCYEVSIKQMANELGYNKDSVENLIKRFEDVHNVLRFCKETKEILLLNWGRYNWTSSEKFRKPLEKEISNIKSYEFKEFLTDKFHNGYGIDTTCINTTVTVTDINNIDITNNYINSNSNINNSKSYSFDNHTNIENLNYVINHSDLVIDGGVYMILMDWMEYKDQKKPKSVNHYGTEKGITTLITRFTKNCKDYGLDAVRHAVEESIANNYQGIVWEKAQQFKGGKGNYTYKPQQTTTTNDLDPQITAQLRALEEQQLASMPDVANMSDEDIDKLIRGEL